MGTRDSGGAEGGGGEGGGPEAPQGPPLPYTASSYEGSVTWTPSTMMELPWPETPCSLLTHRDEDRVRQPERHSVDSVDSVGVKGLMQSCVLRAAAEPLGGGD